MANLLFLPHLVFAVWKQRQRADSVELIHMLCETNKKRNKRGLLTPPTPWRMAACGKLRAAGGRSMARNGFDHEDTVLGFRLHTNLVGNL